MIFATLEVMRLLQKASLFVTQIYDPAKVNDDVRCLMFSVPCLWGWISHATCHVSQHCQSCATRKCPQTIYFREGSWISAKRCAIKHNESRGADPAPATALTSNSFCHPTFVSFMVSGGNIEVEMWIVDEKWEWCLTNGVAQRLRDDDSSNDRDHHHAPS